MKPYDETYIFVFMFDADMTRAGFDKTAKKMEGIHKAHKKIRHPEFAHFQLETGIDSIPVNPDALSRLKSRLRMLNHR